MVVVRSSEASEHERRGEEARAPRQRPRSRAKTARECITRSSFRCEIRFRA
jgi:hypothetical protein